MKVAGVADEETRYIDFVEPSPLHQKASGIAVPDSGEPEFGAANKDARDQLPTPPPEDHVCHLAAGETSAQEIAPPAVHPDDNWFGCEWDNGPLPADPQDDTVCTTVDLDPNAYAAEDNGDLVADSMRDGQPTDAAEMASLHEQAGGEPCPVLPDAEPGFEMAAEPAVSLAADDSPPPGKRYQPVPERHDACRLADDWLAERAAVEGGIRADGLDTLPPELTLAEETEPELAEELDVELGSLLKAEEDPTPDTEEFVEVAQDELDEPVDEEWLFADDDFEKKFDPAADDPAPLPFWADEDLGPDRDPPIPASDQDVRESVVRRAGARAAALVHELDIVMVDEQRRALLWLEDLLRDFPHGASHAAITRLVLSGISFDHLRDAASLIRFWRADPALWLVRRIDRLPRQWTVTIDRRYGRTALTWKMAAELVAMADVAELSGLIVCDWRDAWLGLAPDQPGAGSYASFLGMGPAWIIEREIRNAFFNSEFADGYSWLRRLDPPIARAIAPDGRLAYSSLRFGTSDSSLKENRR